MSPRPAIPPNRTSSPPFDQHLSRKRPFSYCNWWQQQNEWKKPCLCEFKRVITSLKNFLTQHLQKQKLLLPAAMRFILCIIFAPKFEEETQNQKASYPYYFFLHHLVSSNSLVVINKILDRDYALNNQQNTINVLKDRQQAFDNFRNKQHKCIK